MPLNIYAIEPTQSGLIRQAETRIAQGPAQDAERAKLPLSVSGSIAVIQVSGVMLPSVPAWARQWYAGTREIGQSVKAATADDSINTIVLKLDTPGGSVSGLAEARDTIEAAKQAGKKVVAHVDDLAASAGYYLASAADEIYSARMGMIGSIGTIISLYDYSQMYEDAGVKPVVIATGDYKGLGVEGTEITPEHQAHLQEMVNQYFADFLQAVTSGRGMTQEAAEQVADGRTFLATDAQNLGLIDGVKSFDQMMQDLAPKRATNNARARLKMQAQTLRNI